MRSLGAFLVGVVAVGALIGAFALGSQARLRRPGRDSVREASVWEPTSNRWSAVEPLPARRDVGQIAFTLPDGKVVIVGGCQPCDSALVWDGKWHEEPMPPMPVYAAALLSDGRILAVGEGKAALRDGSWRSLPAPSLSRLAALPGGRALGVDRDGKTAIWESDRWQSTGDAAPPVGAAWGPMLSLADGSVLLLQFYVMDSNVTAQRFRDGRWTKVESLQKHFSGRSTSIAGGLLLADGFVFVWEHAESLFWDPVRDEVSLAGRGDLGEMTFPPVRLADGRVLFAAEVLFNPTNLSWKPASPITSLGPLRTSASSARLRDGRVLVAGGGRLGHRWNAVGLAALFASMLLVAAVLLGLARAWKYLPRVAIAIGLGVGLLAAGLLLLLVQAMAGAIRG